MVAQPSNTSPVRPQADVVNLVEPIDNFTALAVRGTILGAGLLGLSLYVRNSHVFTKFRHVSRIPNNYYKKEIQLKGIVREITSQGLFKVEHQPIISISSLFRRKPKKNVSLLNLRLAGLGLSPEGQTYLSNNLKLANQSIRFEVIMPTAGNVDSADAIILIKKNFLVQSNLNVDLVRKGLARVFGPEDADHINAVRTNSVYCRLISKLLTCEKVADRRGLGLWERRTWVESVSSLPTSFVQIVKSSAVTKFFILLYHVLRDLLFITISAIKHGYYLGVSVVGYTGNAYQSFSQNVDRLSNYYLLQKSRLLKLRGRKSAAVEKK